MTTYYRDFFPGNALEFAVGAEVFTRTTSMGTGITGRELFLNILDANIFTDAVPVSQDRTIVILWGFGMTGETNWSNNLTKPPNVVIGGFSYPAQYIGHCKIAGSNNIYNQYDLEGVGINTQLTVGLLGDEIRFMATYTNASLASNAFNHISVIRYSILDTNNGTGSGGSDIC